MNWCRDEALPQLDQETMDRFSKHEQGKRGSLLSPLPRESKTDLNQIIASISTQDKNKRNWKSSRTKRQRQKLIALKRSANAELPNIGYKIDNFGSLAVVLQNVCKFRELIRLKKVLSEPLFDRLRAQFRIIDADNSGYITMEQCKRINILLDPHLSLIDVECDVSKLFQVAEIENHISEIRWLQAWAKQVRTHNYSLTFVKVTYLLSYEYLSIFPCILSRTYPSK